MSLINEYTSNVTEQDLIILRRLAEQQKNQRAEKIENRSLKLIHDVKLAESLSPIIKNLDEFTKKISEVNKESNSESENKQEIVLVEVDSEDSEDENIDNKIGIKALLNSFKFSDPMKKTISNLMSSKNLLKIEQDVRLGGASTNEEPILILGGDSRKIGNNVYGITPENHKALPSTGYTGKTMKDESVILVMNNILGDVNYKGIGDRESKRKTFITKKLPKRVNEIQNKTFNEIDLQGQGL